MLVGDYSDARPSPAVLKEHYEGVMRYVLGRTSKRITGDEVTALHTAGLTIGIVAEGPKENVLKGRAVGLSDGEMAAEQATAVGFPLDRPIYFASDLDVFDSQFDDIAEYADGFREGSGGRAVQGCYGGAGVVQFCLDNGHAEFGWIASASSWHHGHTAPGAALHQRVAAAVEGCDDNLVLQTDWGQWPAPGDDDMTGDEVRQIVQEELTRELTRFLGPPSEARNAARDASLVSRAMFQQNFTGGDLTWLDVRIGHVLAAVAAVDTTSRDPKAVAAELRRAAEVLDPAP
jgi:hypothetical protein